MSNTIKSCESRRTLSALFAKSPAAKLARNAKRQATTRVISAIETLEGRQMMSATMSAVSNIEVDMVPLKIGTITIPIPQLVQQTTVFSIGPNGQTFESTGPGNSTNLGGYVTQISAGLDVLGKPEVYGVSSDGSVWVNDNGAGWSSLGGTVIQISASNNGTLYALGPTNNVWVNKGSNWSSLNFSATQITAGVGLLGQSEVYATSKSTGNVMVNAGGSWVSLGTARFKQISGAMNDTIFAIGPDNSVYVNHAASTGGTGWTSLGGSVKQISAGLDTNGTPEVFGISKVNSQILVNNGTGWVRLSGSGTQIAAPAIGVLSNSPVAVLGKDGQTFTLNASGFTALPLPFSSEPIADSSATWQNVSRNPLFGTTGPSINDVKQGGTSDCYFLAALGNVAFQDANLIRKDVTQRADGTYDVYFHKGSAIVDEHIDGWLPMNSSGNPLNAQLGQGGATWVAIMEKAFCYFRNSAITPAYTNINYGWATESLPDLGATNTQNSLPSITDGLQLWSAVQKALAKGQAVQFGTGSTKGTLVSSHEYSVLAVSVTTAGIIIKVRNPWGTDGVNSDGYSWVNAVDILPQINEVVTATV